MPLNSRRRRERRERLRLGRDKGGAADGDRDEISGFLRQLRLSGRGKGKKSKGGADRFPGSLSVSDPNISLKKRAHVTSYLRGRGRGRKAQVAAAADGSPVEADTTSEEYPPQDSTSEDLSPPFLKPTKEEKKSPVMWTEEERDLGYCKRKFHVGSVFDPESNSWVAKYNYAMDPMPRGYDTLAEIRCDVCDKIGHLENTCSLMFDYPPTNPPFNRERYELACECGSNDIVPGNRNCIECEPNAGLRVAPKYLPTMLDYTDDED